MKSLFLHQPTSFKKMQADPLLSPIDMVCDTIVIIIIITFFPKQKQKQK